MSDIVNAMYIALSAQKSGPYRLNEKALGLTLNYPQAPCLFLCGGTGEGKTALAKSVIASFNAHSWYVRAPQEEPENLVGMAMRSEYVLRIGDDESAWRTVGCMQNIPNVQAVRLYEAHMQGHPTALIIDEIGDCSSRLQSAYHGPLLDNTFGCWEDGTPLSVPNLVTVGCFNDPKVSTSGSATSHAVATRSCTLDWELPYHVWANGQKLGFPLPAFPSLDSKWQETIRAEATRIVGFLDAHPTMRKATLDDVVKMGVNRWRPTRVPRSWTHAAILSAAARSATGCDSGAVERLLIGGCVGLDAADNYISWRSDQRLGDPSDYLSDTWLNDSEATFYSMQGDVVAATVSMVSAYYMRNKTPKSYVALARFMEKTAQMGFEGQALSEVIYGRLFGKAARTPGMGRRELMKLWGRFMPMVKSSETLRSSANNGTKD